MKAVVMAGGTGTRLRPLTTSWPKPLLPVAGRPLLEHLLLLLSRHGVRDAVITVHYLAPLIRTYFGSGAELDMRLTYVTEPEPMGTAGSVKLAAEALRDEPFLVISGDGLTDVDLTALMDFHRDRGAMVTMCLARRADPSGLGLVVTDDSGRVRRFLEKPGWGQVFADTVNTGIYIVDPSVLAGIETGGPVDWSRDVFPRLLAEGVPIYGYITDAYWEDVGTLEAYRAVQADALDRRVRVDIPGHEVDPGIWFGTGVDVNPGATLTGPMVVGDHSHIGPGAVVSEYSVIGRNAIIGSQAKVERAVLLDNVYLGPSAHVRGCVIGRGSDVLDRAQVEDGSAVGEGCRLEAESVVTAGADVYPHKTIAAGEVVTDSVLWEARSPRQMFSGEHFDGVVNIDITPEVAARVAGAYATILPKGGCVAVARDHSAPAQAVSLVLIGALAAAGLSVHVLGTCPVPVARTHVGRHCDGGIIVCTSPGRPERQLLMFLDAHGVDIDLRTRQDLERVMNRHDIMRSAPDEVGEVLAPIGAVEDYVSTVLSAIDMNGVRDAGLRLVVDTAGGPCVTVLPELMASLDVDVLNVNARLTPLNPTEVDDEKEEALRRLGQIVASSRAALGVRLSPTGEQLSIVDETGRVLSDDRALLVVLDLIAAERRYGAVALPVTATRVAERVTSYHGVGVIRTPTGPQALAAASTAEGLIMAGDADGGFVIPAAGRFPDAMAALVALLGLIARTRISLRQIDTRIPSTTLLRARVATPWARKAVVMAEVRRAAGDLPVDVTEGVRVTESDDSWVLVSADPSAASIRLWVESYDDSRAHDLMERWKAVVRDAAAESPAAAGEAR
ncbi:MAG: sugar phosphate nucleotidyltransferase [Candidatus Nanopelagicales bacterium]